MNFKSARELFFDKVPVNLASVRELFSKSVPFKFQQHTFKRYPGPVPFIFTLRTRSADYFYVPKNMVWPRFVRSFHAAYLLMPRTSDFNTQKKKRTRGPGTLTIVINLFFIISPAARRNFQYFCDFG